MRYLANWAEIAAVALTMVCQAAETSLAIRNPQLGGVLDEQTRQLRIIEGVPGAANLMGSVSDAGAPILQAWFSPNAKRALVRVSGDTPGLAVADWNVQTVVLTRAESLTGLADLAAISPSAKAFTRALSGKIESWQIGAGTLQLLWTADAPDGLSALAVSDDGALIAAVVPDGIQVFQSSGRISTIAGKSAFGAMNFAHNSHAFLFGEETSGKALFFEDVLAQPSAELSWDVVAGEKLVGAGFSGDNQLLAFAASTETAGRVRVTNLAGQNMTVLDLDARPIGLYRALGNAVFQLSTSSKGTIYMLDADSPEARLVAVPGQEVVNE